MIVHIDGPDDLVPVPRVEDLARLGHAKPHPQGGYTISPRGYELIREAQQYNAPALRRMGEAEEARRLESQARAAARVITIDSEVGRGWQHKG